MKFSRAGEVAFIRPLHETSTSQQMTQAIAFDCGHRTSHEKENSIMTNFGLIGAAAIALLAARRRWQRKFAIRIAMLTLVG
jgi:hypothetical protein